jgi:hypothetical protein
VSCCPQVRGACDTVYPALSLDRALPTRLSPDRPPSLHTLRRRLLVGFVRGFLGIMQPSDSSPVPRQLRLLDFLSRPGIAHATAGQTRSPRFRRDPFERDVAFDPGRASAPRIAAPHILPSARVNASAPAVSVFRGSIPHPTQLLCTLRRGRHLPRRNTRYQADATPYLGRTYTGWIAPASPGAPLSTPCRSSRRTALVLSRSVLESDGAVSGSIRIRGQAARSNSL